MEGKKAPRFPWRLGPTDWLLIALAGAALCVLIFTSSRSGRETASPTAGRTELEARLERVLGAVEGAGQVRVMIREEAPQTAVPAFAPAEAFTPGGVVVVAEGADDLTVCFALSRAVQALLGVDPARIEIIKMQEDSP